MSDLRQQVDDVGFVLTGGALRHLIKFACSLVKVTLVVAASENAGAQPQELNLLETHVPKSVVPTEELFLGLGEVEIAFVDGSYCCIETFGGLGDVNLTMGFRSR